MTLRLLFPLVILCVVISVLANDRPIIGILSAPSDDHPGMSEFSASYVKWLESAGARVAPVRYDLPQAELKSILSSLNGLLFTGGDQSLNAGTPYFETAKFIFDIAVAMNTAGDHFPVCLCLLLTILRSYDYRF